MAYLEYIFAQRIDVLCQDREWTRYAEDGEGLDREAAQKEVSHYLVVR